MITISVLHIASRSEALLPADELGRARATSWMFAALNSIEIVIHAFRKALADQMAPFEGRESPVVEPDA